MTKQIITKIFYSLDEIFHPSSFAVLKTRLRLALRTCCRLSFVSRPLRTVACCSVVLSLSAFALAGDLTVDNLTVSNEASVFGAVNIKSGVVVITNEASATGGTITTNGNYRIHTFTNIGATNFTVSGGSLVCDVLVIAGGGGGGGWIGGGGGGGGVIFTNRTLSGEYMVTVGAGGHGGYSVNGGGDPNYPTYGSSGSNSCLGDLIALGGGAGGGSYDIRNGFSGGSGGGGGVASGAGIGADGTSGQGNKGGNGYEAWSSADAGGGGGGSGGEGVIGAANHGGNGGAAYFSSLAGVTNSYAGGGGGGTTASGGTIGYGGGTTIDANKGGGGDGGKQTHGASGLDNTGGGGGAGAYNSTTNLSNGGNGGSGIVIVRYTTIVSSNINTLSLSSNGISQANESGTNTFMGKVGMGTNNPAEQLHVAGNVRVDGTNIVSVMVIGGESRTNWPSVAVGSLMAENNLSELIDKAAARTNLGLGSAATNNVAAFDPAGAANSVSTSLVSQINAHVMTSNNPHNVTASQVGALGTNGGILNGTNVFLGKVGVGVNPPMESLHVVGNARIDGTNIVSAMTLGGITRIDWPSVAAGGLAAANNLSDLPDKSTARANLGLGTIVTNDASAFLRPNGNGSYLTGITATQVGALSTNGGAVNGTILVLAPSGDIPMGTFTNR